MSEMVERVARALALQSLKKSAAQAGSPGCGENAGYAAWALARPEETASLIDATWRWCVDDARAAIEALKEPTEGMVKAGIESVEACTDGWSARAACAAEHAYEAMLQAALSPPEQTEKHNV